MKCKKFLAIMLAVMLLATMVTALPVLAEGETVYTSANGWTLNGSEEQQDGSLAIMASGTTPTVFTPALTTGKKYSITYEVTGLETGSNTWNYPFRMKVSAGGTDVDGALGYRMAGRWEAGDNTTNGTNGTMEVIFDTVTGEWETYALGNLAYSGTFADPSDFTLKFYRWSSDCQAYISNVTVTDITPSIYNSANGWTLNGSEEQQDGSLAIKASGSTPTVFRPTLTTGKVYSITFDVSGLTSGGSDGWAFPFRMKVSAGGTDVDGALAYRMAGRWEAGDNTTTGTNGTMEVIYNTATGEWETYALGNLAQSGTFADPSDFALKFYRWSDACQAYVSNVTVTDITPSNYNPANGWSKGTDAIEQGTSLVLGKQDSVFTPTLTSGNKYEITFDVDVPAETVSNSWSKPAQISLYAGGTTQANVINYYLSGAWMDGSKATTYGNTGDGTMTMTIDTATGVWEMDAPGTGTLLTGSFTAPVTDFAIGLHCEQWIDPATYPVSISNMTVTDITPGTYNSANGWSMGYDATEQGTSLVLGKQDSVFTPTLTSGKRYEIAFDVDVPAETVSGSWSKPAQISLYAGGTTQANVVNYYLSGAWMDGSKATTYGNTGDGAMKVTVDTLSGEWIIDAPGTGSLLTGTFTAPVTGFAIGLHCEQYVDPATYPVSISNVTVTDVTPISYNAANGWTLNGSEEQQNGSLAIKADGTTPTVFRPTLTTGKKYSITYNVTGLTVDSSESDGWAFPFRVKLSAGGANADGVLAYRSAGIWEDSERSREVSNETNGVNEIIFDTATGEWEAYTHGALSRYGIFADPSDFAIEFYRWSDYTQAYISNVTVEEYNENAPVLSPSDIKLYGNSTEQNPANASVDTNKVTVNFGQEMSAADMNDTLIYVKNKSTGVKVADTYAYENGVFTLNFATAFAPQTTYTVVVERVRNASGVQTLEVYEKDFVTEEGRVSADLVSITQNGASVTTKAALQPGAATINLNYVNTKGTTPTLYVIAVYFNGTQMVKADFITQTTLLAQLEANMAINYTVPTMTESYDKVHFMVWSGFTQTNPLSDVLTLQ